MSNQENDTQKDEMDFHVDEYVAVFFTTESAYCLYYDLAYDACLNDGEGSYCHGFDVMKGHFERLVRESIFISVADDFNEQFDSLLIRSSEIKKMAFVKSSHAEKLQKEYKTNKKRK